MMELHFITLPNSLRHSFKNRDGLTLNLVTKLSASTEEKLLNVSIFSFLFVMLN